MGVPLRLAVTASLVYALLRLTQDVTPAWPKNNYVVELNDWINSLFVPQALQQWLQHRVLVSYVRNVFAGTLMYHSVAGTWALYIYVLRRSHFFPDPSKMPTRATLWDHISTAQVALFSYAVLPLLVAFLAENKITRTFSHVSDVGVPMYAAYHAVYLACVEFGVYWAHRELHTIKFLYNNVHLMHHKYNKPEEMSPYCSIAFHPLDGILQASPYVIFSFVVPTHYLTALIMLFYTGIWASNIHDNVSCASEPFMGAKYHTMHHTHYVYNYGQFFTLWDRVFGTLRVPGQPKPEKKSH